MKKPIKTILFVLGASIGAPTLAAEQLERTPREDQGLIHKSAPVPSGIYNMRRPQSSLPNSKKSPHRKLRVKSASETVAARD